MCVGKLSDEIVSNPPHVDVVKFVLIKKLWKLHTLGEETNEEDFCWSELFAKR